MAQLVTTEGEEFDFHRVAVTESGLFVGYAAIDGEERFADKVFPESSVRHVSPEDDVTAEVEEVEDERRIEYVIR